VIFLGKKCTKNRPQAYIAYVRILSNQNPVLRLSVTTHHCKKCNTKNSLVHFESKNIFFVSERMLCLHTYVL
jgi:hypothetical protein